MAAVKSAGSSSESHLRAGNDVLQHFRTVSSDSNQVRMEWQWRPEKHKAGLGFRA